MIPENISNYFLGEVSFSGENTGNWFTVYGDKIRYRIVWECPEGQDAGHHLDTYLHSYDKGEINQIKNRLGVYEYTSDWIDIDDGGDYRFTYFAGNIVYSAKINAKVSVYIDTVTN